MEGLTVKEVLDRLKAAGITDSEQTVRRWVREGEITGFRTENRKEGFRVPEDELERFIRERNPFFYEVQELREELKQLKEKGGSPTTSTEILPQAVCSCLYSGISKRIDFVKGQIEGGYYNKSKAQKEYQDLKEAVEFYKERCVLSASSLEQDIQQLETAINTIKENSTIN